MDLRAGIVKIKNTGKIKAELSGWKLLSLKGEQVFFFPAGTNLGPGEIVKIVSRKKSQLGPRVIIDQKIYLE